MNKTKGHIRAYPKRCDNITYKWDYKTHVCRHNTVVLLTILKNHAEYDKNPFAENVWNMDVSWLAVVPRAACPLLSTLIVKSLIDNFFNIL